jgi:NAD(P)-dependent dehydrogenase (short-subunit alcohol dehydrogenase family)
MKQNHRQIIISVHHARVATHDDIAGAAVYLASPAASYTTGEILIVNGGRAW